MDPQYFNFNINVEGEFAFTWRVNKTEELDLFNVLMNNPIVVVQSSDEQLTIFNYLINNEIKYTQSIPNKTDFGKMMIAALSSNPNFVLVTN